MYVESIIIGVPNCDLLIIWHPLLAHSFIENKGLDCCGLLLLEMGLIVKAFLFLYYGMKFCNELFLIVHSNYGSMTSHIMKFPFKRNFEVIHIEGLIICLILKR